MHEASAAWRAVGSKPTGGAGGETGHQKGGVVNDEKDQGLPILTPTRPH